MAATTNKESVQGKRIVYLFRIYEERTSNAATLLAFVTENENSASVDADSTATKDGSIRTPGTPEIEITSTAIVNKNDDNVKKFRNAMLNNKLVECWEANLDKPATEGDDNTQFEGTYYQGYITEFTLTSNAEDMAEYEITYGANGIGADGNVTVTADQQETASYVFKDTPAETTTT